MTNYGQTQPPGWYPAQGDPPGTHRYWDGRQWTTGPQPMAPGSGGGGLYMPDRAYLPELGRTLADPGMRIVARLIDAAIAVVAALIVVGIAGFERSYTSPGLLATSAVIGVLYEVGMVARFGGTAGKLILGIGVITVGGRFPPGLQTALLRWLPAALGLIPLVGFLASGVVSIVSVVWLFTDVRRRTVNDKFAKTYVVKTR